MPQSPYILYLRVKGKLHLYDFVKGGMGIACWRTEGSRKYYVGLR